MAEIVFEGMSDLLALIQKTEEQTSRICGRALHPGAKIIADECKARLERIRTDDSLFKFHQGYRHGPTKRQKRFLIESMGIAKMRKLPDGYDVKLGFDGYNDIVSERWKNGQPNAMIARSVNKGTSFMEAQPFMDESIRVSERQVLKAIEEEFEKQIERIWKE